MATLRQDNRTRCWAVRFYWNGEQHQRTCGTKRKSVAIRTLATVEETLEDLKRHKAVVPADLSRPLQLDWILSGGKLETGALVNGETNGKSVLRKPKSDRFGDICEAYLADQAQKQDTTLIGERVHIKHLKGVLRSKTPLGQIGLDKLKQYKARRKHQQHNGKFTSDTTIRKELVTFRQIWMWAKNNEHVKTRCPLVTESGRWIIQFEKRAEHERFRTWDEIERRIKRGGLSKEETEELWKGLYLDQSQVMELLTQVQETARHDFIFPMFAFTAYTGARRSEIIRSRIDDIQFDTNQILIRERKRRKDKKETTRLVPLHPKLRSIMTDWLEYHPGGPYTIQCPKRMPRRKPLNEFAGLTVDQAHRHFEATLKKSKWSVVTGSHVLRHSFGSNLIRTGKVPSDTVAKWMGHTTMEMRELYQHLFPQDGLEHISVLG